MVLYEVQNGGTTKYILHAIGMAELQLGDDASDASLH